MDDRVRIGLAEAIGTMTLIVGGPGTAILATGGFFPRGSVGVLGVALAFGLSLLVAAYAIGSISGCHINPAVTLGLWVIGKTKTRELPFYIVGQVIGGLVGALMIFIIANSSIISFSAKASGFASNGYGVHSPGGFKLGAVMLAEVFFTAVFVFIIASTSRLSMPVGLTGITVGLTLTVIHLISIPVDNTSVNPARSLSTAVFQGSWALNQLWVFIVFPIVGGVLGGATWRALRPASDEMTEEASEAVTPAPYGRRPQPE
ncbi:MAG TPA: aquaporin Z [Acidimicrobiales bacterium]|jgi:aquaporin Z|nr:aquaporin Z [Acidimicrobiales bacterium]